MTTYLQNLREAIILRSPDCSRLFQNGIKFIYSCLQQYEEKMVAHLRNNAGVHQEGIKELYKLLQIAQELKTSLMELLKSIPNETCIEFYNHNHNHI